MPPPSNPRLTSTKLHTLTGITLKTTELDGENCPRAILMGSPRSGTTWLAKIIDSHPRVLYRHEPDSVIKSTDVPFVPEYDSAQDFIEPSKGYIDELFDERCSKSAGSQPMFEKAFRGSAAESLHRALVLLVKGGERAPGLGRMLSSLQIPDLANPANQSGRLLFMKSVSSLCRTYLFSLADPQLKFLHIVRHPCAYVASTIRGNRLGHLNDQAYIETLARMRESARYNLDLDKLRAMSPEAQLAARWMLQNEKVASEMQGSPAYRQVIYEDLCANPQAVTLDLLKFLGLEMVQQTRNFIDESSTGKSSEVRYFDINRDSAKAACGWTAELDASQIDDIAGIVKDSAIGRLYFSTTGG